jgi:SAM-dependent methyltransferase
MGPAGNEGSESPAATKDQSPRVVYNTACPVDTGWLGLYDAKLSGWGSDDELFRGVPIGPNDVVVDIGCGKGGYLGFCADRAARVIGVDLDADSLAAARERLSESAAQVEFHIAPAEQLPIADGAATRVVCTEVLEHVADPAVVLRELARVAAPGGLQERMQEHVADDHYFQPPNHIRIIEREEFPAMVSAAGLEVLSQDSYGFFWSVWWALQWGSGGNPDHEMLQHWTLAWKALLDAPHGRAVKDGLDRFLPKSQVIVARKPSI